MRAAGGGELGLRGHGVEKLGSGRVGGSIRRQTEALEEEVWRAWVLRRRQDSLHLRLRRRG